MERVESEYLTDEHRRDVRGVERTGRRESWRSYESFGGRGRRAKRRVRTMQNVGSTGSRHLLALHRMLQTDVL